MKVTSLSRRQISHVLHATARLNIADGPVRSGKTVANNVRWLEYIESGPRGELLMAGKTERTLERNVLNDLYEWLGPKRWVHNRGKGEVHVRTSWGWRTIYLAGGNDERAESKIRGMTLAGAYLNEVSLLPKSFFDQVLARCSVPDAKVFGDTNPDSPYHWLHKDYLGRDELIREGVLRRFRYKLEDNTFLDQQYVADLKRLYTGLWYKRMILGLWVMAEGAVYDMFDEAVHVVDRLPQIERYWVAVDYGTTNPTVFLLLGLGADGCMYVVDEWRWDSQKQGHQKTDAEYSLNMTDWLNEHFQHHEGPERIFIDPSAASFIAQLYRDSARDPRLRKVAQADNDVLNGIRSVASLLAAVKLKIHRRCAGLLEELGGYVWDEEAQKRGEDKPLKVADHGPDALRYGINGTRHVWGRLLRGGAAA